MEIYRMIIKHALIRCSKNLFFTSYGLRSICLCIFKAYSYCPMMFNIEFDCKKCDSVYRLSRPIERLDI